MRAGGIGISLKVNPHDLRVGVIKDRDSSWNPDLHIPEDFFAQQGNRTTRVVGKIKDWNNRYNNGMKNVPRKNPHHK